MCGILAVINLNGTSKTEVIRNATAIIQHRGPDDEGFLLWDGIVEPKVYSGKDTHQDTVANHQLDPLPETFNWKVGFGHRRLSIIDTTPQGHQPMKLMGAGLSITYNGEIYNYLEIKNELIQKGHIFLTHSDTEVILHAWAAWGKDCLKKFNGMFSFALLDINENKLYVVRDRFGVKPLYYHSNDSFIAFASEVKQLRALPDYQFELNKQIAFDYLLYGSIDHNHETFESNIFQIKPGHYIEVDLETNIKQEIQWYTLVPKKWEGTEDEAFTQFVTLLKDSVRLRMRSDVPVGSALSGGLDSSTIVCLIKEVTEDQNVKEHTIKTVTSCSEHKKYDEWEFADEVIKEVGAIPYQTFPSFEKLKTDFEQFLWHMDYPCGSTSQFSQWCVFEKASETGLTVMIDGQGADEQLAGYGGNDLALYTGLLRKGKWVELLKETRQYKEYKGQYPWGFLLGAIQLSLPHIFTKPLPDKYKLKKENLPSWLSERGFDKNGYWPLDLNSWLQHQVTVKPLPSLLRYEDRNSMAFSVESRVPFMDYRLIEFTLGLAENMVYRKGERKYILREAFKGKVPAKILERKDKMGFVSAEEHWLKNEGKEWFRSELESACEALEEFVDRDNAILMLEEMQNGKLNFDFVPWRIICLGRWIKSANT